MSSRQRTPADPDLQTGLQWGVGCLVGGAALVGVLILVMLVSIAVQPPVWVQIVLGLALVGGAICLAWLFTAALRRSRETASGGSSGAAPPERVTGPPN